jgi:leucyl-tRNA synthetase
VWDIASQAWEARELLAPFATHLADTAASLLGYSKADASGPDLKAIESISKPVANGHAAQINFVNNGQISFTINVANAPKIRTKARAERKTRKAEIPTSTLSAADQISYISSSLNRGDLVGTVFNLGSRTWYARMLNGEGVLIPLRGRPEILEKLEDGVAFQFRGSTLLGSKKQLIGINIDDAVPLNRGLR